ncbi:alpha/beta hydrolase-fold protein [Streptomyces sp. MS1.HAVA.3]|uniref:Alpha/beta hydrolase-fold protein n=1 Tax=Streptomyces caledonius TaxID=3134107 RepID=A0ABU8U4Q0_9ACTN
MWLPPQYDDPAYKDKKFPVVELIPGIPGTGKSWFQGLKVHEVLEPLMKSGKVQPFILVSPRAMLLGNADTGCANLPGKVNADSWFSVDVRKMVVDNFRTTDEARNWGVAGYSAGAYCSAKLAISHPDRYSAAVSLSGYNDPARSPPRSSRRTRSCAAPTTCCTCSRRSRRRRPCRCGCRAPFRTATCPAWTSRPPRWRRPRCTRRRWSAATTSNRGPSSCRRPSAG